MRKSLAALAVVLGSFVPALAQETEKPAAEKPAAATADGEYHVPLAGEAYSGEVFGSPLEVEKRDRSSVGALVLGATLHTPRIDNLRTDLFGALYYRRFWDTRFFRATLAGFANE